MSGDNTLRFERRLLDALYTEAMLLAEDAREYFDHAGRVERELLAPDARVSFCCESLKVTTRLLHVIAWLLTQRALANGELAPGALSDDARRLTDSPVSDPVEIDRLPERARMLVTASTRLYARVAQLDQARVLPTAGISPARLMIERLAGAF